MVYLTAPAGGIIESEYNMWSKKWIEKPASGISSTGDIDLLIDEEHSVISLSWCDASGKNRFGIYNINDFSVVYESGVGADHTYEHAINGRKRGMHHDLASLFYGGVSRSLQTYLLLMRTDYDTIEVWRGGPAVLWSRSTAVDFTRAVWCDAGAISLTGKYVLVVVQDEASPYYIYLMLYEGS